MDYLVFLASFCPRVFARFPDSCIPAVVAAVKDPRCIHWACWNGLKACQGRLSKEQKSEILACLEEKTIWPCVIDAVIATVTKIDAHLGKKLLDQLCHDYVPVRARVTANMGNLKKYATRRHARMLDGWLRRATDRLPGTQTELRVEPWGGSANHERAMAIHGLAQLPDELVSQSTVEYIMDTVDVEECANAGHGDSLVQS